MKKSLIFIFCIFTAFLGASESNESMLNLIENQWNVSEDGSTLICEFTVPDDFSAVLSRPRSGVLTDSDGAYAKFIISHDNGYYITSWDENIVNFQILVQVSNIANQRVFSFSEIKAVAKTAWFSAKTETSSTTQAFSNVELDLESELEIIETGPNQISVLIPLKG